MQYLHNALELLKVHEGYRQFPYACSLGIQTIGYGRNLEHRGLSKEEASYLLEQDVQLAEQFLFDYDYYFQLSGNRKAVMIDMTVNMGPTRLRGFKKMHAALTERNYELAALEMLDSLWARQVGGRAITLSKIMHSNQL